MSVALANHIELLRPLFELMRRGVVISLGGGVAVDALLGLPLTSHDIDGRLVVVGTVGTVGTKGTVDTVDARIADAVAHFRSEWIRYGHSITDELDRWFPEPLMDYDFAGDPELRKSVLDGTYVGNAWIGTITSDYMNKLILLVKCSGRAHKLVEVSYGSARIGAQDDASSTRYNTSLGLWCDSWSYMEKKFTMSLYDKSRVLQNLLGEWFNVEPTSSGERYRTHLETNINSRLAKWERARKRLDLIAGQSAAGELAEKAGQDARLAQLDSRLAQLDAELAHYCTCRSERVTTLRQVRAAEEAERATRSAARLDRMPERQRAAAAVEYPRPSNELIRGDPSETRALEEVERAERIATVLTGDSASAQQLARAAEEEERARRTRPPILCLWLKCAVIAKEEEERRRRMWTAPPLLRTHAESRCVEEEERVRRCAAASRCSGAVEQRQVTAGELSRAIFRRAVAAKINRLLTARIPVEAAVAKVLRPPPGVNIWQDLGALRAMLAPHERALRTLLDSAQFTLYWEVRCSIPLRCNMTSEEIGRLGPIAILNEVLEQWLWAAAHSNLTRLRAAVDAAAAAAAKKQHSDNMTAELFQRLASVDAIAKELESLRVINAHINRIAPGIDNPEVTAVRNWIAQEPWAHVARCTLAHIHREKCDIVAALERALATVSALHVTCAARTMANPAADVWRQCYKEFTGTVKEAMRVTSGPRRLIRSRPDWFQRKLNIVEIDPSGTAEEVSEALARGLRQQDPSSRAWSAFCDELVAAEQFSERLMADRSEGLRGWQSTLRVTHAVDWSIMYIEGILQHVSKIETLAEFMGWVVEQCRQPVLP